MNPTDLVSIPLFEDLDRRELQRISGWMDDVDLPTEHHIVHQGAFAYEFFVILDGQAEVLRDDEHLADLGPGDFFGEIALVERDRRTATVVARTPVRLGVMLGRDFMEMEEELPHVAERIARAVEERRPK